MFCTSSCFQTSIPLDTVERYVLEENLPSDLNPGTIDTVRNFCVGDGSFIFYMKPVDDRKLGTPELVHSLLYM